MKQRYKKYSDGTVLYMHPNYQFTDLQEAIRFGLEKIWRGKTSVFAIKTILAEAGHPVTTAVLQADLLQMQDMGQVAIGQNPDPKWAEFMGWTVTFPGYREIECKCCGQQTWTCPLVPLPPKRKPERRIADRRAGASK